MESIITNIFTSIKQFIAGITYDVAAINEADNTGGLLFTAVARWVFIALALFILVKSIWSLLRSSSPSEVFAYLHVEPDTNVPINHWENIIGRGKKSDIIIDNSSVSRLHGTLSRDDNGQWTYRDLGSKNGAMINGREIVADERVEVNPGDSLMLGSANCTIFPMSLEERRNNMEMRKMDTLMLSPWTSLIALSIFQILTLMQLKISLGEDFVSGIAISFIGLCALMWGYVISLEMMKRKGFEMETIAFFLSTLSLAVTATKYPEGVLKQFVAIVMGLSLFLFMCTMLRNLNRAKSLRNAMYIGAAVLLIFNLVFATERFGANNWVSLGGLTFQPSEFVKLAFIWAGAASLDELLEKRNTIVFMLFSGFCFCCLALMGDFGTAIIFFVTFLVISFLRSGDFTKLILIVGVAFVGGLMVLKYKSYIAKRFAVWGHVWDFADGDGFQQTRTMSAASSGGFVGVGAGNGWLKDVPASETDLVFGLLSEEWGLIIALFAVIAIITLSVFAVKSVWAGRSTYYTIAACSAMSMFLFQTILNVFGSVDLFPLTGVTFPFVSAGGTSMIASWGLLAFLKAADTRQNASFAISLTDKSLKKAQAEERASEKAAAKAEKIAAKEERKAMRGRKKGGKH
ncbi:MAG: FtsW/RodA/SpoVE family cell cycle protein [Clostridia bacterium]|nr:FtsW/RodA/SpoVE family cell cycle protein [Clostridia bacterium]MDO5302730.1 FtsW/RodA/SpoVE family cell cycle protein [Clostridia bacterium]